MADFEFIEALSGAGGFLAQSVSLFHEANDGLTKAMSVLLPGGVDELNSIDADCNTCKHLQRLPFDRIERPPNIWGMPGKCAKDGRDVIAWGNGQFIGASCWESRKSDRKSAHSKGNAFDGSQYAKAPHWGLEMKIFLFFAFFFPHHHAPHKRIYAHHHGHTVKTRDSDYWSDGKMEWKGK